MELVPPSAADVVTIDKTGENFRLLYDVKGRFTVHRIMPEEAKVGLLMQNMTPSPLSSSVPLSSPPPPPPSPSTSWARSNESSSVRKEYLSVSLMMAALSATLTPW